MDANLDKIQILETTLRDGSYVIDFQFTAADTFALSRTLDQLGIRLIEVGHGVGLNAGDAAGHPAADDLDYVRGAREAVKHAQIGAFCIPGIARLDDLRASADAGLQFVRIGADVDEIATTEAFIGEARKLGLFVFSNFMKSYAMSDTDFADIARVSANFGSQAVYLVDSAGGMVPDDIRRYMDAMRNAVDLPLGFHGHNNLNLAVANSLIAIEHGATIVDTTLLGMGRSSGNAPTEVMIPLLQRCHEACRDLDPILFVELAERAISPFLKNRWDNSEKTALGLAQVHSNYADRIRRAAEDNGKNFFSLIGEVGHLDKLNLPPTTLESALAACRSEEEIARVLGDISMIEEISSASDLEGIVTAATKLNIPIEISITTESRKTGVERSDNLIHVTCLRDDARALEHAAQDAGRWVRVLSQELDGVVDTN